MTSPQSLGGRTRARRLNADERRRIARKAARARWTDPRNVLKDRTTIEGFCRKFGLQRLYAFGSILTPSFNKSSDVDLLYVSEEPLDYVRYCEAIEELRALFGRSVDFIDRRLVEQSPNEFRKRDILDGAKTIYEAR